MRTDSYQDSIGSDEVMYYSLVTGPEDDKTFEMVGKIIVEFGRIEYIVKLGIERLSRNLKRRVGIDENFSTGIFEAEREKKFQNLCDKLEYKFNQANIDDQKIKSFKTLLNRLQEAYELRNTIVHGCWSTDPERNNTIIRSKMEHKVLKQWMMVCSVSDLKDFFHRINYMRFCLSVAIGTDDNGTDTVTYVPVLIKRKL